MLLSALLLAWLAGPASASTWYFLRYNSPSGEKFTGFSGSMLVPPQKTMGVYYLWPGLQPTDNSGVYQNVLDGRKAWWVGSGWCCSNPNLPWGSGFNVAAGDTVRFSNVLQSDNSAWASSLEHWTSGASSAAATTHDTFALASKSFNQVLFAIELDGPSWDFGPLQFSNVTITSTGKDSSWCTKSPENYNSATVYSVSGAKASTNANGITCTIDSVILQKPK